MLFDADTTRTLFSLYSFGTWLLFILIGHFAWYILTGLVIVTFVDWTFHLVIFRMTASSSIWLDICVSRLVTWIPVLHCDWVIFHKNLIVLMLLTYRYWLILIGQNNLSLPSSFYSSECQGTTGLRHLSLIQHLYPAFLLFLQKKAGFLILNYKCVKL